MADKAWKQLMEVQEAREMGLAFYFTGRPCKNGHVYKRRTTDSSCLACKKPNRPQVRALAHARTRCRNKNYWLFHRYGGRGIQCHLTLEQVDYMWRRDKAHLLKRTSLDRIDNDGHYTLTNCRFIENAANSARRRGVGGGTAKLDPKKVSRIRKLYQNGVSTNVLAQRFGVCHSNICYVLRGDTW